jgi:hypothetical protein
MLTTRIVRAAALTVVSFAVLGCSGNYTPLPEPQEDRLVDLGLLARADAAGVPLLEQEMFETHTHALVRLTINGDPVTVPGNIGVDPYAIAALHTHAPNGIVHVESAEQDDTYTTGQFLTLWGLGGSADEICTTFQLADCSVTVAVVTPTAEEAETLAGATNGSFVSGDQPGSLSTVLADGVTVAVSVAGTS